MNRETRRLLLGSAAGIGAALAAHYALTANPSFRRTGNRVSREDQNAGSRRAVDPKVTSRDRSDTPH